MFASLNEASEAVAKLRLDLLMQGDGTFDHLPRYAEQELLIAISHLELAARHLKLGWFDQMQPK